MKHQSLYVRLAPNVTSAQAKNLFSGLGVRSFLVSSMMNRYVIECRNHHAVMMALEANPAVKSVIDGSA